ncbi:MAG TPA: signal peptidase I [Acidimicrobiales bacterium]
MSLPPLSPDVEEAPAEPIVKTRSTKRALAEWGIVVVVALVISLLIRTFVFQTFFIPSGSMEPTLQIGDRIVVSKLSVEFGTIHTGDIVVFKAPKAVAADCGDNVADLVKRVVATPGQTIWSTGNTIYVDGKPLQQPWTHVPIIGPKPIAKTHVSANHYFMLGDNEDDSCDSRYWGLVPRSSIIGKAFFRLWPFKRIGFL